MIPASPIPALRDQIPGLRDRVDGSVARALARITGSPLGPYQAAVVRIGFSFTWLVFLVREWPHRQELYGPDGPWSWEMARQLTDSNHAFSVLMWSDGRLWSEFVYGFALVSAVLLLLGWRTRTMSVLFMIGVLSLQNRSIFMGDGGDNVVHLMSVYIVFTRCGLVWSLDARCRAVHVEGAEGPDASEGAPRTEQVETDDPNRTDLNRTDLNRTDLNRTDLNRTDLERTDLERDEPGGGDAGRTGPERDPAGVWLWSVLGFVLIAVTLLDGLSWGWALFFWLLWTGCGVWWTVERRAPGEPRAVLDMLANLAHNGALLVIMAEVCLIYATAGWYKIQGSRWQDGTAIYYPFELDYFSPWPELAGLLGSSGTLVLLLSYGTVAVQVAFPFTLLNRRAKNLLLALMMMEHLGIAVLLGLPFFSLAMIAADAVFLPTAFLVWAGARAVRLGERLPRRRTTAPSSSGSGSGSGSEQPDPTPVR